MENLRIQTISSLLAAAMLALGAGAGLTPAPALASGGSGGGGTSGGSGSSGGGGGTTSAVITFSNFGAAPPPSGGGWAMVGVQASGNFNYDAEQFTATVTGAVSGIRIPIHQYDTGGNGQFSFNLYTSNPPGSFPEGTLIGSFRGQSARDPLDSSVSVISVSNGPQLIAGQQYWAEVAPSSQSREAWAQNQLGLTGLHFGRNAFTWAVSEEVQGAFEISVLP